MSFTPFIDYNRENVIIILFLLVASDNTQFEALSSLPMPGLQASNFGTSAGSSGSAFPNVGLVIENAELSTSNAPMAGLSNLPTPMNVSNDKYGALADLLALSELDASSFSAPPNQLQQQHQDVISNENDFFSSTNQQTILGSSAFQTLNNFNSSNFQTNFNEKSKTEEEDFGDFIAGSNSQIETAHSHIRKDGFELSNVNFATFASTAPNVNVMTWHESR